MKLKKPYLGNWKLGDKFGMRVHPIQKIKKMHNGQDISIPAGSKLYAPLPGDVYCAEDNSSGKFIVISSVFENGKRVQFIFCHLSEILVKDGAKVSAWQDIGLVGNTGASTGAHLHLGVKVFNQDSGKYEFDDPIKYFDFGSVE